MKFVVVATDKVAEIIIKKLVTGRITWFAEQCSAGTIVTIAVPTARAARRFKGLGGIKGIVACRRVRVAGGDKHAVQVFQHLDVFHPNFKGV